MYIYLGVCPVQSTRECCPNIYMVVCYVLTEMYCHQWPDEDTLAALCTPSQFRLQASFGVLTGSFFSACYWDASLGKS